MNLRMVRSPPAREMTRSPPIERRSLPPAHTHESSKPFSAIKRLRVSPRIVTRFVADSLLSLKSHAPPRGTHDLAAALQKSCTAWKKNVLHVEDLRKHLRQLPSPPSSSSSPPPAADGVPEQLPHALLVYDEASAAARANYVDFLQASRDFAQSYVDAVLERMRFQNGALEDLMALLEMARRLRGEAVQLKVSFKRGPCKQFKCIVKEVNSKTLPLDVDIFKDIDLSLKDILAAYRMVDRFWVSEVESLSRAIDTVHVERVRVERWLGYKDSLAEAVSKWKVRHRPISLSPFWDLLFKEGWGPYERQNRRCRSG
ncbi:hypothetical protein BC826DRAFT_999160 [Russula brevipes]|nr:hypothetical protein BC826DRAFT_999160 [Russula brevipes]